MRGEKKRKLDAGKEKLFHFDLDDILRGISNRDAAGSLEGNITAKAGTHGIDEAKAYLGRMVKEGALTTEESQKITTILMRYSTWR